MDFKLLFIGFIVFLLNYLPLHAGLEKSLEQLETAKKSVVSGNYCPDKEDTQKLNTQYINSSSVRGKKHMLVIGDSITFSNCKGVANGLCGWRKFLSDKCSKDEGFYSFDTMAKVGISAQAVVKDFPKTFSGQDLEGVLKKDYDAAMVLLGTNDIGAGSGSIEGLKANYTKLVTKLKAANVKEIFFMSVFPTCAYGSSKREKTAKKIQEVNNYLKDLAASNPEISFVNVYNDLESKTAPGCLDSSIDGGDHLHPKTDAKTQARIAELVARELKSKLDCSAF